MTTKAQQNDDFSQQTPEPVITYNHMETDGTIKMRATGAMPVWSFVIEEFTIICLLAALYFSK